MLGESQIIAVTGKGKHAVHASNKVSIWDCLKRKQIAQITTSAPIIRLALTASHLAVVLKSRVNLYRHQREITKVAEFETANNPLGLCCLDAYHLIIPGRTHGQMQIISLKDQHVSILPAHSNALQALAVSSDGAIVASASRHGTLIRLHSTTTCARLAELRRGIGPATIFSLAISPSCEYLAVTSNTNTLHVFAIPKPARQQVPDSAASATDYSDHNEACKKWGSLATLPFAPKVFSDTYSLLSATFDPGKELEREGSPVSGVADASPPKGVVGWIDDETIVIVNAGRDARYERFAITLSKQNTPTLCRAGWSRFMRPN